MERKNKIIIAFLAFFLLLGILIFFWPKFWPKKEVEDDFKKSALSQGRVEWIKKKAPQDLAVGDPLLFQEDCKLIKDKKERELCFWNEYMIKASTQGDVFWCKKIKDIEYKDYCLRVVAQENNNPEECRLIETNSWENVCFMEIARQNQDKSICQEIDKYPFVRKKCIAQIDSEIGIESQDVKKCLFIPKAGDFRNVCLWDIVAKKGSKVCEEIEEVDDKNLCYDWYYLTLADQETKKELCEKIVEENFKRVCFKLIEQKTQGIEFYFQLDSDGDRVDDLNELGLNTNPFLKDTDGDKISDSEELWTYHSDPLDPLDPPRL